MNEDTQISSMRWCAQFIDSGLKKIENSLSSADSMVPSDEFIPVAEDFMSKCVEESKEMDELTANLKQKLSKSAESIKLLNKTTAENLEQLEADILCIEDKLEKFGYNRFEKPTEIESIQEDLCKSINNTSFDDCLSEEFQDSGEEDITPYVLRKSCSSFKSRHSSTNHSNTPSSVLSCNGLSQKRLDYGPSPANFLTTKIPTPRLSPHGNPLLNARLTTPRLAPHGNPPLHARPTPESVTETKLLKPKPQMPILSQFSYDVMGEIPPPEFYELESSSEKN